MRLDSVGKRYGPRQPWVVRGASAAVPPGRLIRVEGRNGSGKSTLLRLAAGIARPSAGRVTGRPDTGYVPERFPGALPFTGREYLVHLARVHGLRGRAPARVTAQWLTRLGADGFADQPLRSMSKGMCQKMAVAQALLPSPGLLVRDEAWTGLDQAARSALDDAVAERIAAGGSVLFVDHDPARLAGRENECWRLDGSGAVTVVPGPAGPARGRRQARLTVRLETTDAAAALDRLRAIDGIRVLAVDVDQAGDGGAADAAGTADTAGDLETR
jgi:ABC-2 type transport system ATP-binding protein